MRSLISNPVGDSLASDVGAGRTERGAAVTTLTLYLFLLMAIPQDLVFSPLGAAGSPSTMFALLVFVIYLGMWLRPSSFLDRARQPIRLIGVLFTCVMVATYASANRHLLPVLQKNSADRGLIFLFGWLGIQLLAADGIESVKALRILLRRQVFGAVAVALLGIAEFFSGIDATNYIKLPGLAAQTPVTDLLVRGGLSRIASTTSQPIEFGAVVVMTIPFALHQARFSSPEKRVVRWLQAGVLIIAAPLSVSRSAILALVVVTIVLLPTWPKKERRRAYMFAAAGLALFLVLVPSLFSTLLNLVVNIGSDPSAQSRTKAIARSWAYVSQHPWLGHGFSTFSPLTYFFVDDQYLMTLIETGFVGLLALIMLFVGGWAVARQARRISVDAEDRHLAQCLAASVAAAAVSFSDYDAFSFPMASGLSFMVMGCCGAYWRFCRSRDVDQR